MMPCYRPCSSKRNIIEHHYQSVNRERICFLGYFLSPMFNHLFNHRQGRFIDALSFHRMKTLLFKPIHLLAPSADFLLYKDQCKRNPLYVASFHLLDILQRKRTRSQIARIGIRIVGLKIENFKIGIRNNSFTSYYCMTLERYGGRHAANRLC